MSNDNHVNTLRIIVELRTVDAIKRECIWSTQHRRDVYIIASSVNSYYQKDI